MAGYRVYLGADRIVGGEEGGAMAQVSSFGVDFQFFCTYLLSLPAVRRGKRLEGVLGWEPQEDLEG